MAKQKLKTHKATAKRFKITGTKKVMYEVQGNNHLRQNKSTKQKARKSARRVISSSKERRKLLRLSNV